MKGKKVLVLHSSSDLYGASNSLYRSLISLQNLGLKPMLILSENGPLTAKVKELGVETRILRLGVLRKKYFNIPGFLNRSYYFIKSTIKIINLIKSEKYELILTNTSVILSGALAAKLTKTKHIWHIREIIVKPVFLKNFIAHYLNFTGDLNVFVSEATKCNYSPILNLTKSKVIFNGIDYSKFEKSTYNLKSELNLDNEVIIISMIARVNQWKGQLYFLEIANKLSKINKKLHFVLVGDPYPGFEFLLKEIDSFIKISNLSSIVSDLGFRLDTYNILSGTDIFILPSTLPDPLPTTVLEAMASRKPVIATNHGGALEMVVNGETGFLIPHDDAKVAAEKIQELIDNPELRRQMGIKGQDRLKQYFSIDAYLENFGKAVLEVMNQ
ncbi:glycosyltransferase family 4 protein [Belliella pelovolcani]|uniref:Glycosyltransferase involved in cell wall bisynthesis n=1 Tax=Belliella pelovolcani TaxID=529505 RepID=A0A1N7KHV0_9BACT|nr:glycosyltransferase family 4 protein [Belliella pelovolcani]SIS61127.1 Glycosyltransferase involved in cell wall bisynthesis [Belliella pelovolcani]